MDESSFFPCQEEHFTTLIYQLPASDGHGLSQVFETMEVGRASLEIEDYSVSQTTLDDVFIHFANQQSDVMPSGDGGDVMPSGDGGDVMPSGDGGDVIPSGDGGDVMPSGDGGDVADVLHGNIEGLAKGCGHAEAKELEAKDSNVKFSVANEDIAVVA